VGSQRAERQPLEIGTQCPDTVVERYGDRGTAKTPSPEGQDPRPKDGTVVRRTGQDRRGGTGCHCYPSVGTAGGLCVCDSIGTRTVL
jgi:hypothetical protein